MSHTCEDELVVKVTLKDVPYFNAPVFLENKQRVSQEDADLSLMQRIRFAFKSSSTSDSSE